MHTIIINDCKDANAATRQTARVSSLLTCSTSFIGVQNDLEAAGNLIDALDAFEDQEGAVLVNVAPRNGAARHWKNGTPFGYFRYQNVLVLASIDGYTLSLVKKYKLANKITVLDIPTTLDVFIKDNALHNTQKDAISTSQFRSFDFLPRAAAHLVAGNTLNGEVLSIDEVPDAPAAIWWVDNFGNCKTTLWHEDIKHRKHNAFSLQQFPYHEHLKDVPDNSPALITGSSGLGNRRFLEIVIQGKSATTAFDLVAGSVLE